MPFQEVDTYGLTLPVTKHNFLVRHPAELLDIVPLAFQLAESGRPGRSRLMCPRTSRTPPSMWSIGPNRVAGAGAAVFR